jgi:hypothetical protein
VSWWTEKRGVHQREMNAEEDNSHAKCRRLCCSPRLQIEQSGAICSCNKWRSIGSCAHGPLFVTPRQRTANTCEPRIEACRHINAAARLDDAGSDAGNSASEVDTREPFFPCLGVGVKAPTESFRSTHILIMLVHDLSVRVAMARRGSAQHGVFEFYA